MKKRSINIRILLCIYFATYSTASYAYLDPGTASMILQGAIAAIAGALITIRLYWHRIKSLFAKSTEKEAQTESEKENDKLKDDPSNF
jgi:hypothetical protein